ERTAFLTRQLIPIEKSLEFSAIFLLQARVAIDVVQELLQLIEAHGRIRRQGSCESHAPAGDVMRAEAHADILRLEKYLVAPGAPFPADAGGLGATKRLTQVPHVLAVDETHAGFDGSCHAVRAP